MRERRLKFYFVSEEEVLRKCLQPFPDTMAVIQHKELPQGYNILSVHRDDRRCGFVFLVTHPSFPEIAIGSEIPVISDYDTVMKVYEVKPYKGKVI